MLFIENEIMEKTQENLLRRIRAYITMDGGHFFFSICYEEK